MSEQTIKTIKDNALWVRRSAMTMVHKARLGHLGGDFSATDILSTLFFGVLNFDPKQPMKPDRDRFIMSKGHATGALYSVLCRAGYYPEAWLETYMQEGSRLNGHPNRNYLPGVEANTGPLGHGLPIAIGIAIAGKTDGADYRTFVLTGDGELQEGSNWEAAMTAAYRNLSNLTVIVDRNRLQQGQGTEETTALDPLADKWRAFGWETHEVDGHDHKALLDILGRAPSDKPRCVIANTTKGKGVSFMEGLAKWHHGIPNDDEFDQAMRELV